MYLVNIIGINKRLFVYYDKNYNPENGYFNLNSSKMILPVFIQNLSNLLARFYYIFTYGGEECPFYVRDYFSGDETKYVNKMI